MPCSRGQGRDVCLSPKASHSLAISMGCLQEVDRSRATVVAFHQGKPPGFSSPKAALALPNMDVLYILFL